MSDRPPPGSGIFNPVIWVLGVIVWALIIWGANLAFGETRTISRSDRGGLVRTRVHEIEQMRAAGIGVEITAPQCLSSCTMYLGADVVCISPYTVFGFHAPSYYGAALSPEVFEYWSKVIASHYPEPLRRWFMEVGRYKTAGYYRIDGRQIIKLGDFEAC